MRAGLYKKTPVIFSGRMRNKFKKVLIFSLAFFTVITGAYTFFERIYPNYIARAEAYAKNVALKTINQSIYEALDTYKFENSFSKKLTDESGKITSIELETIKTNKFKADITAILQKNIDNLSEGYIGIPFGSLSNKEIFSGLGPDIKVKISPVGIAKVDFAEEFISCGINSVKHRISLNIAVDITLVSATMRKNTTVTSQVPIAETIINGTVPYYYGSGMSFAAGEGKNE